MDKPFSATVLDKLTAAGVGVGVAPELTIEITELHDASRAAAIEAAVTDAFDRGYKCGMNEAADMVERQPVTDALPFAQMIRALLRPAPCADAGTQPGAMSTRRPV